MAPQIVKEIPETWDTIKHSKPVYPTYSSGKFGKALYCNDKYHCYSVLHIKPFYELMPYRATGFGFGERSLRYLPLSHVSNTSKPKSLKVKHVIPGMQQTYNQNLDSIKSKRDVKELPQQKMFQSQVQERNSQNFTMLAYGAVGESRYRSHVINRTLCKYGV